MFLTIYVIGVFIFTIGISTFVNIVYGNNNEIDVYLVIKIATATLFWPIILTVIIMIGLFYLMFYILIYAPIMIISKLTK